MGRPQLPTLTKDAEGGGAAALRQQQEQQRERQQLLKQQQAERQQEQARLRQIRRQQELLDRQLLGDGVADAIAASPTSSPEKSMDFQDLAPAPGSWTSGEEQQRQLLRAVPDPELQRMLDERESPTPPKPKKEEQVFEVSPDGGDGAVHNGFDLLASSARRAS